MTVQSCREPWGAHQAGQQQLPQQSILASPHALSTAPNPDFPLPTFQILGLHLRGASPSNSREWRQALVVGSEWWLWRDIVEVYARCMLLEEFEKNIQGWQWKGCDHEDSLGENNSRRCSKQGGRERDFEKVILNKCLVACTCERKTFE